MTSALPPSAAQIRATLPAVKMLAVIEAIAVNGPAKNLLAFCRRAASAEGAAPDLPRVEASIVTFHRAGDRRCAPDGATPFVDACRAADIEVDVIHERFRFDPSVIQQLRRIAERRAPDVLQSHMIKSHFLVKSSGLGRRFPWIAFHHGYTTTDVKMRLYNHVNRWSLPSAARVVTVCGPFARHLERAGVAPERISVLHNSVEAPPSPADSRQSTIRDRLSIRPGERVILAVGRLSREKGHVTLVRTLEWMVRAAPDLPLKLVIVGDGPERGRVQAEAARLGMTARIVFAGETENPWPFYGLSDALALPSWSEGSPNVLLEAMAAGLPVAANAVGGVPEIAVDGETALLVPAGDTQAMGRALSRLLRDRPLAARLAAHAREHVGSRFSPSAYARALLAIYRHVLPERVAPSASAAVALG